MDKFQRLFGSNSTQALRNALCTLLCLNGFLRPVLLRPDYLQLHEMDKLRDLEAALSGNNLEAIWLASAAWSAQRESTATADLPKGTLSLKALDRLLSLSVQCCKEKDPKNCYIMSLTVLHMAPNTTKTREELKLVREGLRACLQLLLQNFLQKEAKPSPGDEIQLCISLQNFCSAFEKIIETSDNGYAAQAADTLLPVGNGVAAFDALHACAIAKVQQPETQTDPDQQKLQDLCHFCRFKVSRTAAQLLSTILQKSSNLGRQGGSAKICKNETCQALLEELRFGVPDVQKQRVYMDLLWLIVRRTQSRRSEIHLPEVVVKYFEEKMQFGKMIQNTMPKDFPVKKIKLLNEVSECCGGILHGTCALRWGHLNLENVKVTFTKNSLTVELSGVGEVMELPWVCLALPEILMQPSCPTSFSWPLQLQVDLFAASVLRAIPPGIVKSIDQQQVMNVSFHEDPTTMITKLHELLHKEISLKASKADGKGTPKEKGLQPRRVTRSMARSQSLEPSTEFPPTAPVRATARAKSAAAPNDANKKKGLWQKATDIARSAKAMLVAPTAPTAPETAPEAIGVTNTEGRPGQARSMKRSRSAETPRSSSQSKDRVAMPGTDVPNSSSCQALPSGLNSSPSSMTTATVTPVSQAAVKAAPVTPATHVTPETAAPVTPGQGVKRSRSNEKGSQLERFALTLTPAFSATSRSRSRQREAAKGTAASVQNAGRGVASPQRASQAAAPRRSASMQNVRRVSTSPPRASQAAAPRRSASMQNVRRVSTSPPRASQAAAPRRSASMQNVRRVSTSPPRASQAPAPPHSASGQNEQRASTSPQRTSKAPEAASPGGASVASRVSLGEAAGLANEAANLGIMGPEKLRQTCADHGLPSEGLRTELISRLLIHRLTSAPPTRGEFSPLSPSFAPFSSPNRSELRKACVQRGLSDVGSSHELLRRLQESRKSSTEDSPAAIVRNTLAAARKATGGEGATPTTEMPTKKRLRSKSPASCLYGRPPSDVNGSTPPKRLRSKSPAAMAGSPRQNLTEGLSDVCGAAVQSLLMLRPQQLEAECKRQGLSPRKSPHAMAYRLATARLRDLASSASAAPTELLSPVSSILKRGKFGTSRGRSPTPPRSRRVSFAGHMSDEVPRTPRSPDATAANATETIAIDEGNQITCHLLAVRRAGCKSSACYATVHAAATQ
eukprot:symbB.v1.2.025135.t1/scaffold2397.1/size108975/2